MSDIRDVKKIDIHAHATMYHDMIPPFAGITYSMISKETLIDIYDKLNVETGVLLPLVEMCALPLLLTNEDCKIMSEGFLWNIKLFA